MPKNKENPKYRVVSVAEARVIAANYLKEASLEKAIIFGLPEIDDRFDIWRVPLKSKTGLKIGEVVIDARTTFIDPKKSTSRGLLENRLAERVIKYYPFKNNVVLDPSSGTGTTAMAAISPKRRFAMLEQESAYMNKFKQTLAK